MSGKTLWRVRVRTVVIGVMILMACLRAVPAATSVPVEEWKVARQLRAETRQQKALRRDLRRGNWTIVFSSNAAGASNIYRMNADGLELKRLTSEKPSHWAWGGWGPQVSPDGKRLLWMSTGRKAPSEALKEVTFDRRFPFKKRKFTRATVWTLKANGSDWRFVSLGLDPSWSPDGRFVTYAIDNGLTGRQPVAVFDMKTRTESVITPTNWSVYQSGGMPRYTPNGKWILSGGGGRFFAIPLLETESPLPSGGRPVRLLEGRGDRGCSQEVSPDGKRIVWVVDIHNDHGSWLGMAPLDFNKPRKPEPMKLGWPTRSVNYDPCFSPDGKYLVYMHGPLSRTDKSYNARYSELYACRFPPDGVTIRLTWLNAATRHPHWVERLANGEGK